MVDRNEKGTNKENIHCIICNAVTITALFALSLITASQHASATVVVHHKVAVHHKAHTASKDPGVSSNVHKVVAVIPETHGASAPELLKIMKSSKGNVIGGTIVDGY